MKVEMGNITIKNSDGDKLTITYEEARQLKRHLKTIFPEYNEYYHRPPYPYIWRAGTDSVYNSPEPHTNIPKSKTTINLGQQE